MLSALGVALLSARQVLLPVRRLSAAAQALGQGKLDTRLPVHGRDELAGLTARFNDAAAALELSVSELRSLEAMSRRFVADVSHELRTPLTAMTAVADMLSDEADHLPEAPAQAVRLVLRRSSACASWSSTSSRSAASTPARPRSTWSRSTWPTPSRTAWRCAAGATRSRSPPPRA
ncbi:HAMP domain-containing protein [Nonomuraea thailandensis]